MTILWLLRRIVRLCCGVHRPTFTTRWRDLIRYTFLRLAICNSPSINCIVYIDFTPFLFLIFEIAIPISASSHIHTYTYTYRQISTLKKSIERMNISLQTNHLPQYLRALIQ